MLVWLSTVGLLPFVQGFMLCAGLIIAIGPQNLFLLRQGLGRRHRFVAAFASAIVDLLLIAIGVGGLGSLIAANQQLIRIVTVGGATFLLGYGIRSFRYAWCGCSMLKYEESSKGVCGWQGVVFAAFSFSLLNPAAYVDTVLMIGTTSGRYPVDERIFFGMGAAAASCLWFFMLTYGASSFTPLFRHSAAWRTLDAISGCLMFGIASSLATSGALVAWF